MVFRDEFTLLNIIGCVIVSLLSINVRLVVSQWKGKHEYLREGDNCTKQFLVFSKSTLYQGGIGPLIKLRAAPTKCRSTTLKKFYLQTFTAHS